MRQPAGPRLTLHTQRLILTAADPDWAPAVADFYSRNAGHLAPWSPPLNELHMTAAGQQARLARSAVAFIEGAAWMYLMSPAEETSKVTGFVHLSQVVRGVFQSAMLGYAIDAEYEGRGLMREALEAVIAEAFSDRGRLHRIQANVVPSNTRSLGLLERLGFQREGLAKDYLFIGGKWQDHVMTSLLNPDFRDEWL